MKGMVVTEYGDPSILRLTEVPSPRPRAQQILVRVRAVGVNRADCMQRAGHYPPPPGESNVLGLECAGEVVQCGPLVTKFKVGDPVFCLVASGAYAERVAVDQGLALKIPAGWDYVEASTLMEAGCTANETLFHLAELKRGEVILVHAAGSGVGAMAIQMAKSAGATVYGTAGSTEKIEKALRIGADRCINYKSHDFVEEILRASQGAGVDVVEDFIGADYLMRNLTLLRESGRLALVSDLGGTRAEIDITGLRRKRLSIFGFTLRAQAIESKRQVVQRFQDSWLQRIAKKKAIRPIVHSTFPLAEASTAHRLMEANGHFGKIVLTVD